MADILLTHSYHLAYDPKQIRRMQPYPPLGTLYAAASLHAAGISVSVCDTMLRDPLQAFPEAMRQQPKLVVIYEDDFNFLSKMCLTRMRELAWQLAQDAKAEGATVIAHGSAPVKSLTQCLPLRSALLHQAGMAIGHPGRRHGSGSSE